MNRLWTILLAFALVCAFQAASTPRVHADSSVNGLVIGDDLGGGGGGGTSIGDPDVPTASKGHPNHGSLSAPTASAHTVGDGNRAAITGMMRLRVVLQLLRMRWLGI